VSEEREGREGNECEATGIRERKGGGSAPRIVGAGGRRAKSGENRKERKPQK